MIKRALGLLLPAVVLTACATGAAGPTEVPGEDRPYVVMVSFDGMRYDFLDRVPTPNFDRVAASGVRATGLIPSYPSKTFPNHYTLATGLYPQNHGIVDNAFYDPAFEAVYALGSASVMEGRWYGGEPIWVTAEKQGVTSGSYFWVGSEAPVQGIHPTYWKPYDGRVPNEARVDSVLSWLRLPAKERPHLVTLYFSTVDGVAHDMGPDAAAVDSAVAAMDLLVGRLLEGLEALPIRDRVHLVLVSDHGMATVPTDQVIYVEDLVDLEGVRVVNNTTQMLLYFDGHEARLREVHEALQERLTNARVFLKEETPERWHYRDSHRIGDLVIAADLGWIVRTRQGRSWDGGGMHGWDPYLRPMHGIFLAMGPRVRAAGMIPAFQNIHVYPFVARLLDLEPAEDLDGRLDVLEPYLQIPAPVR